MIDVDEIYSSSWMVVLVFLSRIFNILITKMSTDDEEEDDDYHYLANEHHIRA